MRSLVFTEIAVEIGAEVEVEAGVAVVAVALATVLVVVAEAATAAAAGTAAVAEDEETTPVETYVNLNGTLVASNPSRKTSMFPILMSRTDLIRKSKPGAVREKSH